MRKIPNINTHIFKQPNLPWSLTSFSAEAQAAFALYDSLGDGLTGAEKTAMAAYIDAEVASGNHTLKDYETIYSLSGNNALVDYIGGKTATNVNAATQDINGFTFDGSTNYINTNFIPSTHGVNYGLDDAHVEAFVKDVSSITVFDYIFGISNSSKDIRLGTDNPTSTTILGLNDGVVVDVVYEIGSNELIAVTREDSSNIIVYVDGVSAHTEAIVSTALPTIVLTVGALNNGGVIQNFAPVTISSLMMSGVLNSNSEHNTNLRALLTSLGVTL